MKHATLLAILLAALPMHPAAAAPSTEPTATPGPAVAPVDEPMRHDPQLPEVDRVRAYPSRLLGLWLAALKQPDAETRRQAANALGSAADMPGVEKAIEPLSHILADPDEHPLLRLSAAAALDALDAKEAASVMLEANRAGVLDMALITDPALARWKHAGAIELWLERVADPDVSRTRRLSAIDALKAAEHAAAAQPLRAIVMREQDPGLRLAAASAVGALAEEGLASQAEQLTAESALGRVLAGRLLASHRDEAARRVQLSLVKRAQKEPAAATVAVASLIDRAPESLVPHLPTLLGAGDANVRLLGIEAARVLGQPALVDLVAQRLGDRHPQVRAGARDALAQLASASSLKQPVRAALRSALQAKNPLALEQAAYLAGVLDDEASWDRLTQLLDHETPEVGLAAAVALRQLAAEASLASLADWSRTAAEAARAEGAAASATSEDTPAEVVAARNNRLRVRDRQMAQMFQLFGSQGYQPIEPLLRAHIAKSSGYGVDARAAAIWALGKLFKGSEDGSLARSLLGRVTDKSMNDPEAVDVQVMSAVSLGRIGAQNLAGGLERTLAEQEDSELGIAIQWALAQMRGEPMPEIEPSRYEASGYFLEPVE